MKKRYIDNRNWKKYNEELVKRGEFYIRPIFLAKWNLEIKQMNAGKVGQPYLYPKSMIEALAVLHCKSFDYRALEGVIRALSEMNYNFPVINYSQICRRVNGLEVSFETHEENIVVAIDGSGEKVSNRGEWIRQKWKVRRGWIKVVIMGSKKGVIDIRVGPETLDERKAARGMIRNNHKIIDKINANLSGNDLAEILLDLFNPKYDGKIDDEREKSKVESQKLVKDKSKKSGKARVLLLKAICKVCEGQFFGLLSSSRKYCGYSCKGKITGKLASAKFVSISNNEKLKMKAQNFINHAIKAGRIIKPEVCSNCGYYSKIEAHHPDYSKPNEVIWWCQSCHSKFHYGHEIEGELVVYNL